MHLTSNPIDWYAARAAGVVAYVLLTVVVSLGITALVLWLDGRGGFGLAAALYLPDWQPWRVPSTESIQLCSPIG